MFQNTLYAIFSQECMCYESDSIGHCHAPCDRTVFLYSPIIKCFIYFCCQRNRCALKRKQHSVANKILPIYEDAFLILKLIADVQYIKISGIWIIFYCFRE